MDNLCPVPLRKYMNYRSIFLEPDWIHRRFLGWSDVWPDPDLRILTRRDGPVRRHLVVSALPSACLPEILRETCQLRGALSEVTLHDLIGSPDLAMALERSGFNEISAERMLNNQTAVIDLTLDEDRLFASMSADTRRLLRNVEQSGVKYIGNCQTEPALLRRFLEAYSAMAVERGLAGITRATLDNQFASGCARLSAAVNSSNGSASFALTFEAGRIAMYHHGVSDGPRDTMLGRAVQWGLIRELKHAGFAWYDMGGLPTLDPANGITRFKLGFGGEVIDLGREFRWTGLVPRLARWTKRPLGR